jgi:hypothetical protein
MNPRYSLLSAGEAYISTYECSSWVKMVIERGSIGHVDAREVEGKGDDRLHTGEFSCLHDSLQGRAGLTGPVLVLVGSCAAEAGEQNV